MSHQQMTRILSVAAGILPLTQQPVDDLPVQVALIRYSFGEDRVWNRQETASSPSFRSRLGD